MQIPKSEKKILGPPLPNPGDAPGIFLAARRRHHYRHRYRHLHHGHDVEKSLPKLRCQPVMEISDVAGHCY